MKNKRMGVEQTGQFRRIRKKKRKKKEGRRKRKREGEERGREKKEKWVFCFSLRSTKLRPLVFIEARGKVGPRNKGYA